MQPVQSFGLGESLARVFVLFSSLFEFYKSHHLAGRLKRRSRQ